MSFLHEKYYMYFCLDNLIIANYMKLLFFSILMLLSCSSLVPQTPEELKNMVMQDSLSNELKINHLIELTKAYRTHNLDSAMLYATKAEKLAFKLNNANKQVY